MKSFASPSSPQRISGPVPSTSRFSRYSRRSATNLSQGRGAKAATSKGISQKWGATGETTSPVVPDEIKVGKTYILPDKVDGRWPAPIPMYQSKGGVLEMTTAFKQYKADDPAVTKLKYALNMARAIELKYLKINPVYGWKKMAFWLGEAASYPTHVRISSDLELTTPEGRAKEQARFDADVTAWQALTPAEQEGKSEPDAKDYQKSPTNVSAATAYRNVYKGAEESDESNFLWSKRKVDPNSTTANAFETEFSGFMAGQFANLMIYDREELLANPLSQVANDILHEFYYHLSVSLALEKEKGIETALSSDEEHGEGNSVGLQVDIDTAVNAYNTAHAE